MAVALIDVRPGNRSLPLQSLVPTLDRAGYAGQNQNGPCFMQAIESSSPYLLSPTVCRLSESAPADESRNKIWIPEHLLKELVWILSISQYMVNECWQMTVPVWSVTSHWIQKCVRSICSQRHRSYMGSPRKTESGIV